MEMVSRKSVLAVVLAIVLLATGAAPAAAQVGLGSDLLDLGRDDDRAFSDERRRRDPGGSGSPLGVFGQRIDVGPFDVGLSVVSPGLVLGARDADAASMRYRLTERSLASTDVGVDLRLRWPSWTGIADSPLQSLQPYLSIGPTLSRGLVEPAGRSARGDTGLPIGLHGGVGLTWKLAPEASLYGEYRRTQERPFGGSAGGDVGSDLFYGFSLRF
jgi:hypothetical protein